jgi:hypothetical protein
MENNSEKYSELQTKTCTTFYYRTERQLRRAKEAQLQSFFVLFGLMDMEKQKGDGLRAFVVRFAMVLNSLDSFLCANKNDKHNFFPKHLSL